MAEQKAGIQKGPDQKGPDQKGPDQKGMGAHLGGHLRENGMLMALVAIVAFFTIVVRVTLDVDFLSAQKITNLFLQNSYVIIMALGMLLVIVAGHTAYTGIFISKAFTLSKN